MLVIISIIIGIFLSAMFSGLETGSYVVNRINLRNKVEKNIFSAVSLNKNLSDSGIFLFTVLIGNNLILYLLSLLMTNYYISAGVGGTGLTFLLNIFPWSAEVAATLTLILPIFIFGEVLPKNIFMTKADILMYKTVKFQSAFIFLFKPLTCLLKKISLFVNRQNDNDSFYDFANLTSQKVSLIFSECIKYGIITPKQNVMIEKSFALETVSVSKIMVPLNSISGVYEDDTPKVIENKIRSLPHRAIPVFRKNEKSVIIGCADFFDILNALRHKTFSIENCLQKQPKIKYTSSLYSAYMLMHKEKKVNAIVIKKNRAVGIIWLRDIVKYLSDDFIT